MGWAEPEQEISFTYAPIAETRILATEQILEEETDDHENLVKLKPQRDHSHGMDGWHKTPQILPVMQFNKAENFSSLRLVKLNKEKNSWIASKIIF